MLSLSVKFIANKVSLVHRIRRQELKAVVLANRVRRPVIVRFTREPVAYLVPIAQCRLQILMGVTVRT